MHTYAPSPEKLRRLLSAAFLAGFLALPAVRADDSTPPAPSSDSGPSPAGDAGAPPAPAEHHAHGGGLSLPQLTAALDLTADQQAKVGPILKDLGAQRKAIRDDDSLSDDDKKQKMKDLRKAYHDQIAAVLTPDQLPKFEAFLKKAMGHSKPAPAPSPAPEPAN